MDEATAEPLVCELETMSLGEKDPRSEMVLTKKTLRTQLEFLANILEVVFQAMILNFLLVGFPRPKRHHLCPCDPPRLVFWVSMGEIMGTDLMEILKKKALQKRQRILSNMFLL